MKGENPLIVIREAYLKSYHERRFTRHVLGAVNCEQIDALSRKILDSLSKRQENKENRGLI